MPTGVATLVYMVVMVQALSEVPLDAVECYLLVAVVMPTTIHAYFVFSGASIRHK